MRYTLITLEDLDRIDAELAEVDGLLTEEEWFEHQREYDVWLSNLRYYDGSPEWDELFCVKD